MFATLSVYFKTQFIVVAAATVLSWIVLSVAGVKYALLLACITGALSVIPVLGTVVSAVIASLVAAFDNARFLPDGPEGVEGIVIFLIYMLLNIGIDWLLAPYLTGKMLKIHPLIILGAVLLGTAIFGIGGSFLAVPALLIIKILLE